MLMSTMSRNIIWSTAAHYQSHNNSLCLDSVNLFAYASGNYTQMQQITAQLTQKQQYTIHTYIHIHMPNPH